MIKYLDLTPVDRLPVDENFYDYLVGYDMLWEKFFADAEKKTKKVSPTQALHIFKDELTYVCHRKISSGEDTAHFDSILTKIKSMNNLDVEKARQTPIRDVLKSFGIDIPRNNKVPSIYKDERTNSMHIYEDTNSYYDFGMCKGGDVIRLAQDYLGIKFKEAVKYINSI